MFFEPSLQHPYTNGIRGNMVFTNNTAGTAGNELFGGWGNICISHIPSLNLYEVGEDYFNFVQKPPTACSITQYNTTSYPGSTVHFSVVTTGQRFVVVPGIVTCNYTISKRGYFPHSPTVPDNFEPLHRSGLHCILTQPC